MLEDVHRKIHYNSCELRYDKSHPLRVEPKELARMKLAYSSQFDSLSLFQQPCEHWA